MIKGVQNNVKINFRLLMGVFSKWSIIRFSADSDSKLVRNKAFFLIVS